MKNIVLLLMVFAISVLAEDSFEYAGVRVALKVYDDCSKAEGFSSCLKKKALTALDRLSRMEKISLIEGVTIKRESDVHTDEPAVTEDRLEKILPRSAHDKDDALNSMLMDKVVKFVSSRTLQVNVPKFSAEDVGIAEGRKGGGGLGGLGGGGLGGGGGGGGKGGKKGGGMMGGLMMAVAAKMAALIPVAIAGLFLLAGKALITAKIALLLSGIIAIKKLFSAKQGSGGVTTYSVGSSGHGGGGGGGGGGGWQSSGHGGGWDKRSIDQSQTLAYKAYRPK